MRKRALRTIAVAIAALGCAAASASAATTVNVSPTGTDSGTCGPAVDPCATVGQGVTNASPGDTVKVGPGLYLEQVTLGKQVNLVGSGQASTTIGAPASLATKFTTSGPNKPVVYVPTAGSGSTISDMKVDGRGQGNANNRLDGIAFDSAAGTVRRVQVVRVRNQPLDGVQAGTGILANNGDSVARTVTIDRNVVSDFQKNGMTLAGTGLTVDVTDNTVTGAGPSNAIAQNGIQVSGGAGGTVDGNTVTGMACTLEPQCTPPTGVGSAGLLVFGPGAVTLSDNDVSASDLDVYVSGAGPTTITGNRISGPSQLGIGMDSSSAVTPTITGNSIVGTDVGAEFFDEVNPTFRLNRVVGNTTGLDNENSSGTITAQDNWWGCNAGPNSGTCDTTTGSVDSTPWLVFRATANPTSLGTGGSAGDVFGRVDQDNTGAAVDTTGFPVTPVGFSTDLGSVDPTANTADGVGRSRLTSGSTTGTATVTADLDGQDATTTVSFVTPPSNVGPQGQQGVQGPQGQQGPQGPPGASGGGGLTPSSVSLRIVRPLRTVRTSSGLSLRVACTATSGQVCSGNLVARARLKVGKRTRTLVVATKAFRVSAGRSALVRLSLSRAARKALLAGRTLRLTARAESASAGGKAVSAGTTAVSFSVKKPARKRG